MLDEKLYSPVELADKLSVTRQTVYRWKREGMPYHRVVRSVRFKLSEVEEWINEKSEEYEK